MSKTHFYLALSIVLFIFFQCSTTKPAQSNSKKISGSIKVVGNEPFTSLAIQTDNGKTFLLRCPPAIRTVLLNHQGQTTTVWYDSLQQTFSGESLHILAADTIFHQP